MRWLGLTGLGFVALAGCGGNGGDGVECASNSNCDLEADGMCLEASSGKHWCAYPSGDCPSGMRWAESDVGDDLAGMCVEEADASVPDAAEPDAFLADAGIDALPPIDADTAGPIVTTYQMADLVLGQADFDTEVDPGCVANAADAQSVSSDNGVLYVREGIRYRGLAWVPFPSTDNANATRFLGKSTATSCTAPTMVTSSNFGASGRLGAGGGKLAVSDPSTTRNRVLLWNPAPSMSGEAADLVVGQPDFTTSGNGNSASQMNVPAGVWTDGTRLIVADSVNNRVLIWTSFPTSNGQAANLVLGQSGFNMSSAPGAATQSNLYSPNGVWSDGTRVVVADTSQNRVLIWTTFPSTNGEAADIVVGQPDFTTRTSGLSATKMAAPNGVTANADALFVADTNNDRVLVFSPFPTADSEAAAFVLGQPDLTTGANNPGTTQQSLDGPREVHISAGDRLWVADSLHRRVLRFSLYP